MTPIPHDPDRSKSGSPCPGDTVAPIGVEVFGVGVGTEPAAPNPIGTASTQTLAGQGRQIRQPFPRNWHERGSGVLLLSEEACPNFSPDLEDLRADGRPQPTQDLVGRHRETGDSGLDDAHRQPPPGRYGSRPRRSRPHCTATGGDNPRSARHTPAPGRRRSRHPLASPCPWGLSPHRPRCSHGPAATNGAPRAKQGGRTVGHGFALPRTAHPPHGRPDSGRQKVRCCPPSRVVQMARTCGGAGQSGSTQFMTTGSPQQSQ